MTDHPASEDYRHLIMCGAYVSLRAIEQRLSKWLNPNAALDAWSTEERARLTKAARLTAEARNEVEVLISADDIDGLPTRDRGTYPDDSLGATIIRVQDYCELLHPIATALHVYENELTSAERDDIVRVEQLLTQAVEIINSQ